MTTPTTPLDLDAAALEAAEALDDAGLWPKPDEGVQDFKERVASAMLTAIGYAELVEEVERLRGDLARLEAGLATVSHAGYAHGSAHPGPAALCGSDFCRQVASNIPHYGPGGDLP